MAQLESTMPSAPVNDGEFIPWALAILVGAVGALWIELRRRAKIQEKLLDELMDLHLHRSKATRQRADDD